jgi:hypothetical protein
VRPFRIKKGQPGLIRRAANVSGEKGADRSRRADFESLSVCPQSARKWVGGTSVGNKERLKGILERQAAAAERERLDEEAASAKAERVRSVRVEVIQKWQEQRAHLETYIAQINKETSKNGVQLFVVKNPRQADTGVGMEADKMEVAFRQRTPHDKKLVISVRANGEAHVSISTSSVSQARQYMLNVFEVTNEQLEATVLDFLDANTPK